MPFGRHRRVEFQSEEGSLFSKGVESRGTPCVDGCVRRAAWLTLTKASGTGVGLF